MKKITLLFSLLFATANIYSQTYIISFAATGAATAVDSVKVENITHPATVKWVAGDVLHLDLGSGINDIGINNPGLLISPNPMQGMAEISFYAKQSGNANISIFDIAGKLILQTEGKMMQGTQKYQLTGLKQGMYIISIKGDNYLYTSKLLSQNATSVEAKIKYSGNEKSGNATSINKSTRATISMTYVTGDSLVFTGFAGDMITIVKDVPAASKTITFTFIAPFISTVNIPGGVFTMGSPDTEVNHQNLETQHWVMLTDYKMNKYEITNSQFAFFLNASNLDSTAHFYGSAPEQICVYPSSGLQYTGGQWVVMAGFENLPVINVTWYGASNFANYAGGTLPSEAQWEYACRGNTTTPFNTGACLSDAQANYNWSGPYNTCTNSNTTSPGVVQAIGSYPPNAYGLYDMHGNVMEWCKDYFDVYTTYPQTDPSGPGVGTTNVVRGGSYNVNASNCRSANRFGNAPGNYGTYLGFRVVMP